MSSLLNKKHTRTFALNIAKHIGRERFTRVSKQFMTELEVKVKQTIESAVRQHPSKGKTLMEFRA